MAGRYIYVNNKFYLGKILKITEINGVPEFVSIDNGHDLRIKTLSELEKTAVLCAYEDYRPIISEDVWE